MALKLFREIHGNVKKFCEYADRRIDRALEYNWAH